MTDSMKRAMEETRRRREVQVEYNQENGITPQSIVKPIDAVLVAIAEADYATPPLESAAEIELLSPDQRNTLIADLERQMREAAKAFEFEKAAQYRDRIKALKTPTPYEQTEVGGADRLGGGWLNLP